MIIFFSIFPQNSSLHDVSMWAQRLLHSDNKKYTLKLFRKELEHAQNVSRKENIRDTMVQESQRAQAIMIVDTLMFGCCFGVVIEGNLPPDTDEAVVIAFSLSLGAAFTFLIISVWFAMNLQSRIAKYRISDPLNVLYGKRGRQLSNFRSYFSRYCKPVYRLTHAFLWFGTVALLMNGAILVASKFSYTNASPTAAGCFIITTAICILTLSVLLWMYNPKIKRLKIEDEEDFRSFKEFVASMEDELTRHDHECKKCRLPTDIFKYCPTTGTRHPSSNVCPHCNIPRESFTFCPTTGESHNLSPQETNPSTERPSGNQANPLNAHFGDIGGGFGTTTAEEAELQSPSLRKTALDLVGARRFLGVVETPRGSQNAFGAEVGRGPSVSISLPRERGEDIDMTALTHASPGVSRMRHRASRLTPPMTPETAARLSPIIENISPLRMSPYTQGDRAELAATHELVTPPGTPDGSPMSWS